MPGAIAASVGVATGPIALDREAAQRFAGERHATGARPRDTVDRGCRGRRRSAAGVLTAPVGAPRTRPSSRASSASPVSSAALSSRSTSQAGRRAWDRLLAEGEVICVDAESGRVFAGAPEVVEERPIEELAGRGLAPGLVNRIGPQPSPCPSDRKLQHDRNLSRDGASTGTSSTFASRTGRRRFRVSWTTALSGLREPATCVTGRRPAARR